MKLNKKQKRTATIASMAALLAVVLGMGGQTFAKYITTDNATAQATVAKWGYVVNVNVDELFGTKYGVEDDTPADKMLIADPNGTAVVAGGSKAVVAPGTEGSATVVISGKAEVKSALEIKITDIAGTGNAKDVFVDDYYPITWTVSTVFTAEDGTVGSSTTMVSGKLSAVESYFEDLSNDSVSAGTYHNTKYTIAWSWPFEGDDVNDTRLGDLSAMTEAQYKAKYKVDTMPNYNTGIEFVMSVGITQIQ